MKGEVVSVQIAALWIAFSEETVRRMCKNGKLGRAYQATGPKGEWRIPTEALEKIRPRPVWLVPDLAE